LLLASQSRSLCLIWPLNFPFSLAHSLLMHQFVITFSKYCRENSASVPHLIFWRGQSPLYPPKSTPLSTVQSNLGRAASQVPISYNGTPRIHPQNYYFLFDDHSHLIHPSLDRSHSPSQTAFRSNQPFCHSTLCRQTDRHTDREWHEREVCKISCLCSIDSE